MSRRFDDICLFLDIDETVVRTDKTVSPRDGEALGVFKISGGMICLVTGRPYSPKLHDVIDKTHADYVITCNGSQVVDLRERRVVFEDVLSRERADMIWNLCEEFDLAFLSASDGRMWTNKPDIRLPIPNDVRHESDVAGLPMRKVDIGEIREREIGHTKVLLMDSDKDKLDKVYRILIEKGMNVTKTKGGYWLEVSSANKGDAVQRFLEKNSQIKIAIPVGDSGNDLPMFREYDGVRTIGIAVANATSDIKDAAEVILPLTNNEDAIAYLVDDIEEITSRF